MFLIFFLLASGEELKLKLVRVSGERLLPDAAQASEMLALADDKKNGEARKNLHARGAGGSSITGLCDGALSGGSVGGGSMFGSRSTSGRFGSSGGTTGSSGDGV